MNKRTLTALKGSIRKWQRIVAGKGRDKGADNCPLCKLFYHKFCRGCPVSKASDEIACIGTPYSDWSLARNHQGIADTLNRKRLAQAELDFLKSLLPKVRK